MQPRTKCTDHGQPHRNIFSKMKVGPSGMVIKKQTFYDHSRIYTAICKHRVLAYWLKRKCLSLEAVNQIDWDVLAKACDEESPGRLHWVTKHVTEMCGIGKFLACWKSQDHSHCPLAVMPKTKTIATYINALP